MGVVYRAQDPAIGRVVAIKTIRLGDLADPDEQAKLRRTADARGAIGRHSVPSRYCHDLRRARSRTIWHTSRWSMWMDPRWSG